jgi:redox-sensitive bicupin YhaK (pirin superfamily)
MIDVRKSAARGKGKTNWLKSSYTFSFADYHDPDFMGFGPLRVINEDFIEAGMGFGMHSHQDMEIITYVVKGELEHKDSLGTGSVIKPGEIQKMSAGSGVQHSEFNHSKKELLHLLQIWIIPNKQGIAPAYEQEAIPVANKNEFLLIGSPEGGEGAVSIQQEVRLFAGYLSADSTLYYPLLSGHTAWMQVVKGELTVNGIEMNKGDGAAIQEEKMLTIQATTESEVLFFDFR